MKATITVTPPTYVLAAQSALSCLSHAFPTLCAFSTSATVRLSVVAQVAASSSPSPTASMGTSSSRRGGWAGSAGWPHGRGAHKFDAGGVVYGCGRAAQRRSAAGLEAAQQAVERRDMTPSGQLRVRVGYTGTGGYMSLLHYLLVSSRALAVSAHSERFRMYLPYEVVNGCTYRFFPAGEIFFPRTGDTFPEPYDST
jgi:hypothetical protein